MRVLTILVFISVFKSEFISGILDKGFCQRTCGCTSPANLAKFGPGSSPTFPAAMTKLPMGSAHGASFGQPWSPWATSGPQNTLNHPWHPASPFISKGGARGTFNKPWTAGAPWLQGSKGMADNSYMPRPNSNANIYKTPKNFLPVETRKDKMLKPADGFILTRRHNKTSGSKIASSSGRRVTGIVATKDTKDMFGSGFGKQAGSGKGGGGALGNKAGPGMGGAAGKKGGPGGDSEKFIKKGGEMVAVQ